MSEQKQRAKRQGPPRNLQKEIEMQADNQSNDDSISKEASKAWKVGKAVGLKVIRYKQKNNWLSHI